jgi:hypothetical protein
MNEEKIFAPEQDATNKQFRIACYEESRHSWARKSGGVMNSGEGGYVVHRKIHNFSGETSWVKPT